MRRETQKPLPLRDYFGGLTEQTFESRLGVADPPLIDYIAELLVRFIRSDSLYSTRNPTGRPLNNVADMMLEAEARVGEARRKVHRQIGDFTLFWTGVYPEALQHLRAVDRKDRFIDYRAEGKRAYRIASTIPAEEDDADNTVLERLSEEFELCIYGLGEVRREWERREAGEGPVSVIWVA
jgi:hypothetical protein